MNHSPDPPHTQPEDDASHSIMRNDRLVAYLWSPLAQADSEPNSASGLHGFVARGGHELLVLAEGPLCRLVVLDRSSEEVLVSLFKKSSTLEAFFFSAGVEGFWVREGEVMPSEHRQVF